MADETVYSKAVDEFYKKLSMMTDSLVAGCNERSPTLFATVANMMCDAAEEATKQFRAANPHSLDA
jgi:hypothetical protein